MTINYIVRVHYTKDVTAAYSCKTFQDAFLLAKTVFYMSNVKNVNIISKRCDDTCDT